MPQRLRILFAGSGQFGLPALEALAERHEIVHIYTQPDRPAGRGRKVAATPIATFAASRSLPLTKTNELNKEQLPPADVLVVIAFGQKISDAATRHPRLGAVNLHASLLPKYRGAAPIHHALINGETVVGNSVIRLARRIDAGAILGQSRLAVHESETTGELHDRLAQDGAPLLLRVLDDLAAAKAVETEQDHTAATFAPKLSREDARLDFTRPASEVAARINGLSPWPGCHVRLMASEAEREEITLVRACAVGSNEAAEPGNILPSGTVACAPGTALEVLEIQPRGRKRMTLTAYRNGHPWEAGMRLQSAES